MLRTKRLMTDKEVDTFIKLREESITKAAKYIKSLQNELFEDITNYTHDKRRPKGAGDFEVTED